MGRRDLPAIALLALCLVLVGRGCAEEAAWADDIAYADSIADAALDSAAIMREHLEQQEAAYNAALASTEDSVAAWRERAESLRAEAAEAKRRADEVATDLMATLNAEQRALFEDFNAEVSVQISALTFERDDARAEAREWKARHDDAAALYAALLSETHVKDQAFAAQRDAIRLRDEALAAKNRRAWYERGAALAVVALVVLR